MKSLEDIAKHYGSLSDAELKKMDGRKLACGLGEKILINSKNKKNGLFYTLGVVDSKNKSKYNAAKKATKGALALAC